MVITIRHHKKGEDIKGVSKGHLSAKKKRINKKNTNKTKILKYNKENYALKIKPKIRE